MPGCKREDVFDPFEVSVMHCWNRCVRRAWLCGVDPYTMKDYNYRRGWIKERLKLLVKFFAIDVCFYALLSNHWHLVLRNRPDIVETWSDEEVVRRCLIINQLAKSMDGKYREPSEAEINLAVKDQEKVAEYRKRLSHISHFAGSFGEYLGRRINADDLLSGTIWEDRFSCRRIEDDASLLTVGMYVDLNLVRAGESETPEGSEYTSIGDRIAALLQQLESETGEKLSWQQLSDGQIAVVDQPVSGDSNQNPAPLADSWLAPLTLDAGLDADVRRGLTSVTGDRVSDRGVLPMSLLDYLQLVDAMGRQLVPGKSGAIPEHLTPILERLHIHPDRWLNTIRDFDKLFGRSVGRKQNVESRAKKNKRAWIRGVRNCAAAFN